MRVRILLGVQFTGVAQNLDRAQINEICGGNLEGIKPGV